MNKSVVVAGLGFLMMATSLSDARADERWPRWYLGLSGGYTFMSDEDISGGSASASKMEMAHDGFGVGASIGYLPSSSMPVLNALRFEAEVTYHQNNLSKIHFNNGSTASANGHYDSTAYMANMFYDFQTQTPWTPYIGAGAGVATLHLPTGTGAGNNTGSSDNEFAYQFMAGLGYTPESIPNTQWTLGYRYLATTDPKFGGTPSDVSTKYSTNSVELGAKFRF